MSDKVIRVPDWAYANGRKLQGEIVRRGLDSVPSEVREPSICPWCGSQLASVIELKYRYVRCPKCDYKQQTFAAKSDVPQIIAGIGLGTLIGLGIAELIKALTKEDKGGERNV